MIHEAWQHLVSGEMTKGAICLLLFFYAIVTGIMLQVAFYLERWTMREEKLPEGLHENYMKVIQKLKEDDSFLR